MNVFYEEDGEHRVGTVHSRSPASLQIDTAHGRRVKLKAAQVLIEFETPAPLRLFEEAAAYAAAIDTDFLWQCAPRAEFGFRDLAREYAGHEPSPTEAAGVLMKLHSAPMYFYRRGRGHYQPAPAETLKAALAGVEKKRVLQERMDAWTASLVRFECPPEIAALEDALLYAPDRNRPEAKAFERACRETGLSPARLLERCGRLGDTHAYHLRRFLHEFFPGGAEFAPHPGVEIEAELPLAPVEAISLDDIGTTEIDDAFSVTRSETEFRVGIHIAAPALGFAPASAIDTLARARLSTAYMPGVKFTMLPEDTVAALSLDAGTERPVVSLYLVLDPATLEVRGRHTKLERIKIVANLRHGEIETLNAAFLEDRATGLEHEEDLRLLWRLACRFEAGRGKPSVNPDWPDYVFRVECDRVAIERRARGAPLDKLVAELMIAANATWGELLAERDVAAIYRVQSSGKVRMSVHAEPHEGLGVACYAWMTSPLRRYIDLVNQWQLAAAVAGRRPPFGRTSEALLGALRAFEVTHARFDEHQRAMEHYWCLRWLLQESARELQGTLIREGTVRVDNLPLVLRIASLPADVRIGARVRLGIESIDLLERTIECAYRATVDVAAVDPAAATAVS